MEKWNSTILTIKKHIYWKRKQVESYNQQKLDLKPRERHLSTLTMVKTTAICNRMRYNLSILVSRALAFFNFCSYYRESCEDSLTKVPMVVISQSNDQSRIAAFSCIIVIADELKKLMGKLRKVIFWSDGCFTQFRSKFVFAMLTHFIRTIALQWNYNKAHHNKGPMDSVGGRNKRIMYGLVKSRHITISTAEEFTAKTSKGMPSIRSLYLSQENKSVQQLKEPWMYMTLSVIMIWKMSVFLSSIIC